MEVRHEEIELRPWTLDDVPAVAAACQDPEIVRWLALVPQPYTEEDARFYVQDCIESSGDNRKPFAIADGKTGEAIGSIDMHINRMRTGHIGYWMAPGSRGRGLTTAALEGLSRWALSELGLGRVELVADPQNLASQRVAEKAGFTREGVLRSILLNRDGTRRDGVMFSLLPADLD